VKITKTEIDVSLSLAEVKALVKLLGNMTKSQFEKLLSNAESSLVLGIYSSLSDAFDTEEEES
jgi:hypothetical protein